MDERFRQAAEDIAAEWSLDMDEAVKIIGDGVAAAVADLEALPSLFESARAADEQIRAERA